MVVWSQVMKLGPSSSWQKPFCLMCFFRVELTSCHTNQGILRPGKLRLQFVWLCLAHLWSRDPLASGFCYPFCPICSFPPFYLLSSHHVWCTPFLKAPLPYPEPGSVCLLNASKAYLVCGKCVPGNFWVRSFFKMGFNRDDCLTMGSNIKYLWVANCFSLIRTWGAFSCLVKGFKIFALLELFQP